MNKTDLIICAFNKITTSDLFCMELEEQATMLKEIVHNININDLEDKIHEVILKLSGVGGPCFGADAVELALDNQKRLELIYSLLYNFDIIKSYTKQFKKEIRNNTYDKLLDDRTYSYLRYVHDLVETIFDYGNYKQESVKKELLAIKKREELMELLSKIDIKVEEIEE